MPAEPMLLVSLRNRYILKCIDGLAVDAKSTGKVICKKTLEVFHLSYYRYAHAGLSSHIHRSLHKRDNWPGAIITSDISWLTKHPK